MTEIDRNTKDSALIRKIDAMIKGKSYSIRPEFDLV